MTKAKTSCYPWFWHPMWCQINPNNWSPEHLSPNRATISTGLNQTWRLGAGWPPANSALVNLTWWMAIMTIHSLFRRISRIIWQGSPHAMLGGGAGWCFRVRDATLKDWPFWQQSIKHRTLSITLAIYHDQEWQVFLKAIWVDRSPWSRCLMGNTQAFGTNRNDLECAHKVQSTKFQLSFPFSVFQIGVLFFEVVSMFIKSILSVSTLGIDALRKCNNG